MAKEFYLSFEYVLYELSYANLILFSSVLPRMDDKDGDKGKGGDKMINGDDPGNADLVRKAMFDMDDDE